jgi:hypothetical protein
MRGFTVVLVMVMFSALAFSQAGARGVPGYCWYACGPFIPLVSTPSLAFETVSSSPVGASNATGGLQAGARNATLSMTPGNTDAVHTEVLWYSGGGSPAVSPAAWLPYPELVGMHDGHVEGVDRKERGPREEVHANSTYYVGLAESANPVEASAVSKNGKHAVRTYTNKDVERVAAKSEQFRKK